MKKLRTYFQTLTQFTPYQFQIETIASILNGDNVILRAPTGSGKTETAIAPFLFSRLLNPEFPNKLIYVVPLRTLANSLRERTEKLVENWSKVYPLSRPLTVTLQTGENPEDPRFEGDIVFCTIDQMLSSFLHIPYSVGRGSANINAGVFFASYLVFDEIHLLDPDRSFTSLLKVLEQVSGVAPFLLMTATLSQELAGQLQQNISQSSPIQLIGVNPEDLAKIEGNRQRTIEAIAEPLTASLIVENIQQQEPQRVIVICNTVSQAQGLFLDLNDLIEQENLDIELTLLHSRFLPEDRQAKELKLKNIFGKERKLLEKRHTLIATQVIEAGLDLTCEVMHLQLCPMNSLLQRVGRCARFAGEQGRVYVYRQIHYQGNSQALAEDKLDEAEINPKKRLFLPYQTEICEQTGEVLQSHTQSAQVSQSVRYSLEENWINLVHEAEDKLNLVKRTNNRAEFDQKFNQALFWGDQSAASDLIRKADNRSLYVWKESPLIDFDEEEIEVNPQQLQSFSVPLTTLRGIWAKFQQCEYVTDWLFKRISTPKRKESYSQPICTPIHSLTELESSFRILVNPRYLAYDAEIGLQIGVDIQGNGFESPEKAQKTKINEYSYHMDTYIAHLGCMIQRWRNPFSTFVKRNGAEINIYYSSVKEELAQSGAKFLKNKFFPNLCLEDLETLFEILVFLAIYCHDLGKLQVQWQEVMQEWQRISHQQFNGKSHRNRLLAHTDYDPSDPAQKAQYKIIKKRLPNHAVESAYLSREILLKSLLPLLETPVGATREQINYILHTIVLASGRHHSAWAKGLNSRKIKEIQLHPQARETLTQTWKQLSRFFPDRLSFPVPTLSQDCYSIVTDFELNKFNDLHLSYYQLYTLVVRALRLCDQRAVAFSIKKT